MTTQTFRNLHQGPGVLLLANAWDAGSARLIEALGAPAIATTSAGVAWSKGYSDGEQLPVEALLIVARDMARVIRVPLSIDIERGYSSDVSRVANIAREILQIGVAGINIEDGEQSPDLLCAKIETVRNVASKAGVDLFINARTDVYLRDLVPEATAVAEVIRRARLYRGAGCDGIFVPGITDIDAIESVARAIDPLPLNIMAVPGLPSAARLSEHGVRRLSTGSTIAQAMLSVTTRLATEFLAGNAGTLFSEVADYEATNKLFRSV